MNDVITLMTQLTKMEQVSASATQRTQNPPDTLHRTTLITLKAKYVGASVWGVGAVAGCKETTAFW